ncbi:MAG: OmpH family outer membrane protein [Acidobacteria bacterium]|nr:OmpH family outer membrane protein [Acidobacteriota bacterium]
MKKSVVTVLTCIFLLSVGSATVLAQASEPEKTQVDSKLGFIDSLQILNGTEDGKEQIAEVEKFIEDKQNEYDSRRLDLERQTEQFEAQQRTLNAQTRLEMQQKIEEDDRVLRRFQEDTQVEIDRMRNAILERLSEQIQVVIDEFAQDQQLGMIFMRDESQIYVDPALDFTQDIIRIYNQRYPVTEAESSSNTTSPAQP